jgi:hypothetical protein
MQQVRDQSHGVKSLWVPETARTAHDLLIRRDMQPGMIRWWRCG